MLIIAYFLSVDYCLNGPYFMIGLHEDILWLTFFIHYGSIYLSWNILSFCWLHVIILTALWLISNVMTVALWSLIVMCLFVKLWWKANWFWSFTYLQVLWFLCMNTLLESFELLLYNFLHQVSPPPIYVEHVSGLRDPTYYWKIVQNPKKWVVYML